jgi:methyl-accepting chemotaxis protein
MNINDLKEEGINTIFATAMIALILILVILFFVNRLIDPYMSIFYSIKHVMQQAKDGDYSHRINNKSTIQNKEVANSINIVLDKLQNTLLDINSKVTKFLTNDKTQNDDPLIEVQSTVSRLADVYRFRQTIEHDESIEEVYGRIINAGSTNFSKTISIGASIFPDTAESFWQCIKYADIALYHAKETGRNKVVLFDKSLLKDDDINDKSY